MEKTRKNAGRNNEQLLIAFKDEQGLCGLVLKMLLFVHFQILIVLKPLGDEK